MRSFPMRTAAVLGVWLAAFSASAQIQGFPITNNQDLVTTPYHFWSARFVFQEEFVSVSGPTHRLSDGRFVQVRGRELTFYAPEDMAFVFDGLAEGDLLDVGAVLRNEKFGLAIVALQIEARTRTVTASAGAHGSIEPAGAVRVAPGGRAVFAVRSDPRYHIADVRVDGQSVGVFDMGSNAFDCVVSRVTRHTKVEASFARDRRALIVESEFGRPAPGVGRHEVEDGSEVTVRLEASATPGAKAGVRKRMTGWRGFGDVPRSGTGSVARFTIAKDSAIKWIWEAEYEVSASVTGKGRVEPPGGWYEAGARADLKATPEPGYRFVGWGGDVSAEESTANPLGFDVLAPTAVTAEFARIMHVIAASAEGAGRIEPEGEQAVGEGENARYKIRAARHHHVLAVEVDGEPIEIEPGAREAAYVFEDVTGPHTIRAVFDQARYELRVASSQGEPEPAVGRHEYFEGDEIRAHMAEGVVTGAQTGVRFVCEGWRGTGSTPAEGEGLSVSFAIAEDSSLEWRWRREHRLDVSSTRGGKVNARSAWLAPEAEVELQAIPEAESEFAGWSGDVTRRERRENPLRIRMDAPRTVRAEFEREMVRVLAEAGRGGKIEPSGKFRIEKGGEARFAITADEGMHIVSVSVNDRSLGDFGQGSNRFEAVIDPVTGSFDVRAEFGRNEYTLLIESESGVPTPPAGEQKLAHGTVVKARAGTSPTPGATPGTRRVCTGWKATGSAPAEGRETALTFTLTRDTALRWLWADEYELKVSSGAGGRATPAGGWTAAGAEVSVRAEPGRGQRFAGWGGDAPEGRERDNPLTLTMAGPVRLEARFERDVYSVTATAGPHGRVQPDGKTIVDAGGRVKIDVRADANYHIADVSIDGESPGGFGKEARTFTHTFASVASTHTLEATFEKDWFVFEVVSPAGVVNPSAGRHVYEYGEEIRASARPSAADDAEATRHACIGWTGEGDVPAYGTGTVVQFTIGRDSKVTWKWDRQYRVDVASTDGGRVDGRAGWYNAGALAMLRALPEAQRRFAGWKGDVPRGQEQNNPLVIEVRKPLALEAQFTHHMGTLKIEANAPDAPWRISGYPEGYTGATSGVGPVARMPVPVGLYTVTFDPLTGYEAPPARTERVDSGLRATFSGSYTPVPELAVSTTSLEQDAIEGAGASNLVFEVWNAGRGNLRYAISRNVEWLAIDPRVGSTTGELDRIRVDFKTDGLDVGEHEGTLTVTVRGSTLLPRTIDVRLRIHARDEPAAAPEPATPAASAAQGLLDGIVAYYPLDGSAFDAGPHANHGAVHGEVEFVRHGVFGEAGVFDERGAKYVEIPHAPHLVFTNSFALQFWYRHGQQPGRIIQKLWPTRRTEAREWEVTVREDSRMLFKAAWPGASGNFEFLCPLDSGWARGAWNHFAYVYDAPANEMLGYLNGMFVTSQVPRQVLVPLDADWSILLMKDRYESGTDARFDAEGELDEVALWNRALSADEVWRLYLGALREEALPQQGDEP